MSSNMKIQRVCEYCNSTFIARTTTTRLCSDTCRSRFYKKRARAIKMANANKEFVETRLKPTQEIIELNCKPYLTIKEVCLLLNVCDATVRKMIKDKKLPAMCVGIKHLIRKDDIESLFKFVV